uniref:14-3-3 domain-containing protein n=1 Tax=Bionectria ochroleuca TaxID=29856 RepID=A0A8H7NHE2_BIOOC
MVLRGVLPNRPLLYGLFGNMYLADIIIFGGGPVVIPLLYIPRQLNTFLAAKPRVLENGSHTFLARLCEQAERYDDMVSHLKEVIGAGSELSINERDLLAIAYAKMICTRCSSWRIVLSIEQMKLARGEERHVATIRGYRKKVENELERVCRDVLDLLNGSLIPNASTIESKAFYYMMKGDYSRYLAESASGEKRRAAVSSAYNAYKIATDMVQPKFTASHRLRLSLALNVSVFYYEILNLHDHARHLAKRAFDDAIAELDALTKEPNDESIAIIHLLRDNLVLWMSSDNAQQGASSSQREYLYF